MILAARVAENVAGKPIHEMLAARLYGPLGMKDTGYRLTRDQLRRTAPTGPQGYLTPEGELAAPGRQGVPEPGPDGLFMAGIAHDPLARYGGAPAHCSGNAGVFSTGEDLSVFVRMILAGGAWQGRRIFKAETVDGFTCVQTAKGLETRGYGWDVWNDYPYRPHPDLPKGREAVGHTGYTGTLLWIDKNSGLWMVVLTNRVHPEDSDASKQATGRLRGAVLRALMEACDAYGGGEAARANSAQKTGTGGASVR